MPTKYLVGSQKTISVPSPIGPPINFEPMEDYIANTLMINEKKITTKLKPVAKLPPISKKPLVSVVVPTWNRKNIIEKTINSILSQSYKKIEIIVIDDGSTDKTGDFLKEKYAPEIKNKKLVYCWKENGGISSALNMGIREGKGELIAWLSSDDWYDIKKNTLLEKSVKLHVLDNTIGLTYTDYNIVDETKNKTTPFIAPYFEDRDDMFAKLLEQCIINGSSTVIKKSVFYHIGMYNETLNYSQDYDFWLRACIYFKISKIDGLLLNYLVSKNQRNFPITNECCRIESKVARVRNKLIAEKGRPTVCAEICVKDEEAIIDKCINDLIMYVDNIVIFDDGSADETLEKLKKYTKISTIYCQKPKGNVRTEGKDRQKLLEMAQQTKCDWILFIDADEMFEDRYKTDIFFEMKNPIINLYFYLEHNFWHSPTHFRIDELWYKGWFGRLFRNLPDLVMNSKINEHCGGVPNNIPNAPLWYVKNGVGGAKSSIRMKHFGFSDEKVAFKKYTDRMERDTEINLKERHLRYDRMIQEKGLILREWGNEGYVDHLFFKNKEADIGKKLNILIINFSYDPAGVGAYLSKIINRETIHDCKILFGVPTISTWDKNDYINIDTTETNVLKKLVNEADIIHFNQFHPFHEGDRQISLMIAKFGVNWDEILKNKPFVFHNHGGAVLLDVENYIGELKEYDPKIILCTPLSLKIIENAIWLPNIIQLENELYCPVNRSWGGIIQISHKLFFKTAMYVKGSKILLEIINEYLRDKFGYPVNLTVYHDLPIEECLLSSSTNHMTIDNMTQGFPGMVSWESLAQGQVVFCRLDPLVEGMLNEFCDGAKLPIINVSGIDELAKKIIGYCNDREKLEADAMYGVEWMKKYYNPQNIVDMYIKIYMEEVNGKIISE